jgi:hypothetical protein
MPNALKIETKITNFFQKHCSDDLAPKAQKLFVDRVEKVAAQLLTEKVSYNGIDLKRVADSELFKAAPKFMLEVTELFNRVVGSKLPKVSKTTIDVRKYLTEQVCAKGRNRNYRRII